MSLPIDYLALFRALPDFYVIFAPDGTILDQTDQHVESTLVTRDQTVGRHVFDAYPSPSTEGERQMRESLEYVRTNRQPHTLALRYDLERPAAQGGGTEERHWEVTHYPILAADGELQYILQHPQDVTARVRAEHERAAAETALSEERATSAFILDALPLFVWTTSPNGTVEYINRGWYDYTGMPATADRTAGTGEYIHPDDLSAVFDAWTRARESQLFCQFEYRVRRPDGAYRWFLGRVVPRLDAAGELTQWFGCATDIHQQRLLVQDMEAAAETQMALAEQAYQASREAQHQRDTFFDLFQQAPAMICILRGPEHRYEFVNPTYQRVFPGRPLVGLTVAEALPEVIGQGFIDLLDGVYRSGEPVLGNEVPIEFDEADGGRTTKYFNLIYQQFREADGTVAGVLVFAFEVTELVAARHRLERLTETGAAPSAE